MTPFSDPFFMGLTPFFEAAKEVGRVVSSISHVFEGASRGFFTLAALAKNEEETFHIKKHSN